MSFFSRLVCVAALALGPAWTAAAQEGSLTISVGFGPTAEVPDPRASYNGWMSNQTGVTETLMGIDYDMNLYPRLAAGIEQSSPTTWRVTLRDGVTFHDGTPVTAQAVVDAIAPISDEAHPGHNARVAKLLDLADLSTDGDAVVVFETSSPNAAFTWTMSEQEIAATPNPSTAALAFEAGEVDLVINYPETDFARIQDTGAQGFSAPTARLYFYTVNAASGPMANPLIRQAVSYAIDREGIVDAALSGVGGVPAGTVFPKGKGWAADIPATYDPAKAEALLAEAGAVKEGGTWMLDGAPLEIDIVTYASRAALPPTAELTQAFLAAIGVKATITVGEWGTSNDAIAAGDADLFLQAWVTTPQGDPGAVLETLLKSDGGSNTGGFTNARLDELLDQGRLTFDHDARKAIYDEVQQIIVAEAAMIPVFHVSQTNVGVPGLTGYRVHPTETYWITHETNLSE